VQWIGLIPKLCASLALAIAAVAAVTDARTGHIPNWLTLPRFTPQAGRAYERIGAFVRRVTGT